MLMIRDQIKQQINEILQNQISEYVSRQFELQLIFLFEHFDIKSKIDILSKIDV